MAFVYMQTLWRLDIIIHVILVEKNVTSQNVTIKKPVCGAIQSWDRWDFALLCPVLLFKIKRFFFSLQCSHYLKHQSNRNKGGWNVYFLILIFHMTIYDRDLVIKTGHNVSLIKGTFSLVIVYHNLWILIWLF